MRRIAILGCGWLGLPLAKSLIGEGYSVNGSTTTATKLEALAEAGIKPYLVRLSESGISGDITELLGNCTTLIIDVPPKLRGNTAENFTQKIKHLIPFIEEAGILNVLFISSTSVYADDNSIVTEETVPYPDTESGRQLLETEQLLWQNQSFATTILRFGGLIGGERHPVQHLAGRTGLPNPDGPVNLIHRDDCIGIIKAIIEKGAWGEIFNAAAPQHPTRKEYYTKKAEAFGLPLPEFTTDKSSVGKTVNPEKIQEVLGYTFVAGIL